MEIMSAPKKRKPGRPPKPEAERARLVSTKISPAAYAKCVEVGDGSASRGLRLIVEAAAK